LFSPDAFAIFFLTNVTWASKLILANLQHKIID